MKAGSNKFNIIKTQVCKTVTIGFATKYILAKPYHRFAYLCLDNVKMYLCEKFDLNIPCGSRVMSIFTKRR